MATLEYAALAVLVSAVLAVGGAVVDARAVPLAVAAQMRKAFCLVSGGDCFARGGPRPCVVGSRSRLTEHRVAVVVARLRDGRTVLLEELSDGTFRVSLTQSSGAGAGVQFGLEAQLGGRAVGADIDAQAGGDLAATRTYLARDRAAADRLVARLADEGPIAGGALPALLGFVRRRPGDGEAEIVAAVSTRAEAEAALRALGLGPRAVALGGVTGSVGVNRVTGDRTLGLRLNREAGAALGTAFAELSGGAVGTAEVSLVLDRSRRMRELVLRTAGAIHGEASMPGGDLAAGDLREVVARLDLADPQTRALVGRLAGGDAGAARALASRVADRARIDIRHFATTRDERTVGGTAGPFGASRTTLVDSARLVAATGREPGLGWSRRLDCVARA